MYTKYLILGTTLDIQLNRSGELLMVMGTGIFHRHVKCH